MFKDLAGTIAPGDTVYVYRAGRTPARAVISSLSVGVRALQYLGTGRPSWAKFPLIKVRLLEVEDAEEIQEFAGVPHVEDARADSPFWYSR